MPSFRNALIASILSSAGIDATACPLSASFQLDPPSLVDSEQRTVSALIRDTRSILNDVGVPGVVTGRVKETGSIRAKMQRKGVGYEEIYDRLALRVRVATVEDCYRVMAELESLHVPIAGERDDYIANPKPNGYRSLHTAVRTALGDVVEFQVRTHGMHADAELGPAAHSLYKMSA